VVGPGLRSKHFLADKGVVGCAEHECRGALADAVDLLAEVAG
jgi:hypothetical protein